MRAGLKQYHGQRRSFSATFVRYETRTVRTKLRQMLLLRNVRCEGEIVADHAWMHVSAGWPEDLQEGETVRFQARVDRYVKGYFGRRESAYNKPIEVDYCLVYPRKIRRWEEAHEIRVQRADELGLD